MDCENCEFYHPYKESLLDSRGIVINGCCTCESDRCVQDGHRLASDRFDLWISTMLYGCIKA